MGKKGGDAAAAKAKKARKQEVRDETREREKMKLGGGQCRPAPCLSHPPHPHTHITQELARALAAQQVVKAMEKVRGCARGKRG